MRAKRAFLKKKLNTFEICYLLCTIFVKCTFRVWSGVRLECIIFSSSAWGGVGDMRRGWGWGRGRSWGPGWGSEVELSVAKRVIFFFFFFFYIIFQRTNVPWFL